MIDLLAWQTASLTDNSGWFLSLYKSSIPQKPQTSSPGKFWCFVFSVLGFPSSAHETSLNNSDPEVACQTLHVSLQRSQHSCLFSLKFVGWGFVTWGASELREQTSRLSHPRYLPHRIRRLQTAGSSPYSTPRTEPCWPADTYTHTDHHTVRAVLHSNSTWLNRIRCQSLQGFTSYSCLMNLPQPISACTTFMTTAVRWARSAYLHFHLYSRKNWCLIFYQREYCKVKENRV